MYNQIFKDFETIKKHCKKNGNIKFDESAIFELLENLFPQHGSIQTVQLIIEMLDTQRIRDCKNAYRSEILNNKSNGTDSRDANVIEIEEVKVLKKVLPVIDLTEDCPSDEATDKPNNDNINSMTGSDLLSDAEYHDLNESDNEFHDSSDSDLSKHFDEEWNQTVENIIKSRNESPLMQFLGMNEDPTKLNSNQFEADQSNSSVTEVSEILEENNNDPNNNLDGTIFYEELVDRDIGLNNNTRRLDTTLDFRNSNSNYIFIENIINPIAGCSKDSDLKDNINNKEDLPCTVVRGPLSPVPGCSKDFDKSHNFESSIKFDTSIQNDAVCIQEIVPWANFETIYSILRKHSNSPNRKQLTLWDLMSEESSQSCNSIIKRKQNENDCTIPKKIAKGERNDDIDESSNFPPTSQMNNTFNESSNDSLSSKTSEYNDANSEMIDGNQNKELSEVTNSSLTTSSTKNTYSNLNSFLTNSINKLINNLNNDSSPDKVTNLFLPNTKVEKQAFNDFSTPAVPKMIFNNFLTFTDRSIKKEKSETVVSGLLNEISVKQTTTEIKPKENIIPLINKHSVKSQSLNTLHSSVNNDIKCNNHLNNNFQNDEDKVAQIKMEIEQAATFFLNEKPILTGVHQNVKQEIKDQKSDKSDVIKPPKLVLEETVSNHYPIKRPALKNSFVRPATFNYLNTNIELNSQLRMKKDLINKQIKTLKPLKHSDHTKVFHATTMSTPQNDLRTHYDVMQKSKNLLQQLKFAKTLQRNSENQTIQMPIRRSDTLISQTNLKDITDQKHIKKQSNYYDAIINKRGGFNFDSTLIKPCIINFKPSIDPSILIKPKPTATITSASKSEPLINLAGIKQSTSCENSIFSSNLTEVPDLSIYNKLRSMFPDVQASYVKRICMHPPNVIRSNDKEYLLNILIDHLLKEGFNHLRPIENYVEQPLPALSVDERYEYLLGIFPDADPTYLREFVEKSNNSEQVVEQFIQEKLETRDYPTKEQYLAKIKITEQQKQYTTDFKVEQFLELFPDPFSHFENHARQCHFQPIAMEFLKSFFTKTKVSTISKQYTVNKHNLSLTAKALSTIGPDMKSKRMTSEMPTEDIPLLQELAFIKNKLNIQNHINTLKLKEEQLFKELQEKNLLLTCQCCFNDECMPTKCSECNNGHVFCCECIIRGTESTLADGSAHVRCFTECNSEFSIATLQKVLPPTKFSALLKKRQAAEVIAAEVEGLVSCPFCHFASIPPPEDKVFKCLNPECMKESCRQCKELNHVPLRCDEVIKSDKARRLIEEKMSEALIRTCYQCKRQFYKEDGCNRMTCPCGALMCYLCDKPVLNYKHFNAQGEVNSNLCPLWSDDVRMNAIAVRTVAQEIKSAILKINPNLEIDTESLIPKLPPKSKGPHDDIPNANQLPEHVRRVVGAAP